ncbi:prolyl oligopeptidase family serine peptidase [Armatimonas sp.]|uniref:S9 family peptidase n=1 Tax=Armatimonas sp. TaxID=1872638 RepID=UPI00286A94D0|nr:prolyl oligopeptidase family serine peptidase [Armatimonas sp.]
MSEQTELWKQIARMGSVVWPQVAANRPERGVAFHSQRGALAWNPQTGETRRLLPEGVGSGFGLLSPDSEWFYFFKDTKGNEKGHYVRFRYDGTGELESLTPDFAPYSSSLTPFPLPIVSMSASGNRIAFIFVDSEGYHLCAVDIAADGRLGAPKILHEGKPLLRGPVLSADGAVCVVCTNERTGKQQYDLLALDSEGDELARWKGSGPTSLETTAFSPIVGDYRLLCTSDESGVKRPMVWDVAQGESELLLDEETLPGEVVPLCWSPNAKSILLCRSLEAAHELWVWGAGKLTHLQHPTGTITYFGGLGATLSNDGMASVLFSNSQTPRQLMQLTALGEGRVVLSGGEAPQGTMVRSVSFPSSDGVLVQAWLSLPEGDGPFPTVIDLHGGPHQVTNQSFGMGAAYVESGFAYLSVNYRGTPTFGREFLQKIWGDVGHWELEDIAAAHAFLVREGIADPAKIAITGGSYGGYLTLLAVGKRPDLWTAGVAHVALANNAMAYEDSSPLLQGIMKASFGGTPEENPELWDRSSPHTYAAQIQAPILVIQGLNDTRCPRRQMEVYEAQLKELGKNIEVLWFDAGHGVGNTEQAIVYMERILAFLKTAVK